MRWDGYSAGRMAWMYFSHFGVTEIVQPRSRGFPRSGLGPPLTAGKPMNLPSLSLFSHFGVTEIV
jgi:hypothetical protein